MRWLIVPQLTGKPWNGSTIHTEPLGGSEASVAYTARALAKRGEEVHVITHGNAGVFEDVQYYNQVDALQLTYQPWDVVLVSRWVDALNGITWNWKAGFFWSHDMPQQMIELRCNKVVMLSEYQALHWATDPDNTVLIGDGVDLGLFQNGGASDRDSNKLIWGSNPDRGLAVAARIFQEVRKRWPDLELHVYGRSAVYGWTDEIEAPFLPREEDMENIIMHDPLPRYALAAELQSAWALFYPTFWPETYCMIGLEAQAAGAPVICPPLAALPETIKGGILTHDFLNAISQLRNKKRWDKLSQAGIEWAEQNTWDIRADQWVHLAEEVINAVN
jgi:glycosyltransferase involved in cell wall biosynthesis